MVGYQIIQTLLDKFITVIISTMEMSNYDTLILKMLPEKHHLEKENLYGICHCLHFVVDHGNALLFYKTITAAKKLTIVLL
jgi:dGTPase